MSVHPIVCHPGWVIRPADPERDASAVAAIYAPYVTDSVASFELTPPDAPSFARKIEALNRTHAFLVCERGGRVAGYAYSDPHRERAAYRWTVEVSVYIDAAFHRQGVGRELYTELLRLVRARGYRVALAGITLPNAGSVGLHEALGFEPVGVYRGVGWKDGAWRDVGWWQLRLAPQEEDDGTAPAEPVTSATA